MEGNAIKNDFYEIYKYFFNWIKDLFYVILDLNHKRIVKNHPLGESKD